jgi:hypothetical protein
VLIPVSLSLQVNITKETWLKKKYGHMKVQVKKEKKKKKSWTHEGPRKKRKDSHVHKRVKREREDHAKWSYNKLYGNN